MINLVVWGTFDYFCILLYFIITMHGPFSVHAWSVQSPFNIRLKSVQSRLTSVFLKRSSVKRTVHGRFFWCIPYVFQFSFNNVKQVEASLTFELKIIK